MKFYDLCLRSTGALGMAKEMGFTGVGILLEYKKGVFEEITSFKKQGIETAFGVELSKNVKAKAKDIRRNTLLISARVQDREAVETAEVDIVFPVEFNHVMARLAKKNSVWVGFDFSPVLHSSRKGRGDILEQYLGIARIVRKYKVPFLLTSGAKSQWDVRSPSDLIAFGKVLGFQEPDCRKALSGQVLQKNQERLGRKWIAPGVGLE